MSPVIRRSIFHYFMARTKKPGKRRSFAIMLEESIVHQQEQLLRELAQLIANQASRKENRNSTLSIQKRFGFQNPSGFTLLCHALDLIGDCELAFKHYHRFDLSGATKYNDQGEMLLRLYGMLNCAYQQGSAALQLHDLFRAPEKKQAVGAFGELELIRLRHIAGAHTVTYKDPQTGARKSFSLSRPSIRNETIVLYDDCNDPQEWDLFSAVMSYIDWAEAILFVICSKAIQTSLATSPVHLARFNSKLNVIQLRADGDDVDADDDGNILMHIKLSKEW